MSRPCTRGSMRPSTDPTRPRRAATGMNPAGLSLVELLVALTVAILVLAAAIAVTFANRRVMNMDQARTSLNQNLRTGLSIIGDDVQISGERLTAQSDAYLPPVEVQGGTVLVLRRNMLDVVLPVCKDIAAGSADSVFVALTEQQLREPELHHRRLHQRPQLAGQPRGLARLPAGQQRHGAGVHRRPDHQGQRVLHLRRGEQLGLPHPPRLRHVGGELRRRRQATGVRSCRSAATRW